MHEHAACRTLLERALEIGWRHRAVAIRSLRLELGVLSGHDPDHLAADFAEVAAGTPAAGARVDIVLVPLRVHCPACGRDSNVTAERSECPACSHPDTQLIDGTELRLIDVGLAVGEGVR